MTTGPRGFHCSCLELPYLLLFLTKVVDQCKHSSGGHFDPLDILANIAQMTAIFIFVSADYRITLDGYLIKRVFW